MPVHGSVTIEGVRLSSGCYWSAAADIVGGLLIWFDLDDYDF